MDSGKVDPQFDSSRPVSHLSATSTLPPGDRANIWLCFMRPPAPEQLRDRKDELCLALLS